MYTWMKCRDELRNLWYQSQLILKAPRSWEEFLIVLLSRYYRSILFSLNAVPQKENWITQPATAEFIWVIGQEWSRKCICICTK